jgi:mannose-6-phosphate isomerase-like protein (cupin superfamily)
MKNFNKINAAKDARTELHDTLQLTGAEISVNNLPAGASVPFVHYHKKNEEIYFIINGRGKAVIDGEDVELTAGDWLRISPPARRQFFAAADEGISYVCIQVRENSLEEYTADDAAIEK